MKTAKQICAAIDTLFASGRPQAETLADMRQIADRAAMFANLDDDDDDDDFDANFAYDDDDEDDGYDVAA